VHPTESGRALKSNASFNISLVLASCKCILLSLPMHFCLSELWGFE
jgi:hypothetical protein